MAASIIPPPIVSVSPRAPMPASSILPVRSVVLEKPQAAESRESELQADLQYLLDSQAEGLLRGVDADDRSSNGSITPTTRSFRSDLPHQVNRPVRRKTGLRSARKGIYSCILALSSIKSEELSAAGQALQDKEHDLNQIEAWRSKKQGLQEAAAKFDNAEESIRVQRLKSEADTVQEEIVRVESHLSELKARQRQLLKQAAAVENSVRAKLATYTSSLSMLESDIKSFLKSRPREQSTGGTELGQSVWQLPPERRTIELASEQLKVEQKELLGQKEAMQKERDALDEGAAVWKEVASKVTAFEKSLRAEMSRLGPSMTESTQAWDETAREDRSDHMRELYSHLKSLIAILETHLHAAEERGWTLLIAAVGAELDALQRGEQILAEVVGHVDKQDRGKANDSDTHLIDASAEHDNGEQAAEDIADARHDTDEEPDPDLLFSVQDADDDDD